MPTTAQILAAGPLTDVKAVHLAGLIRASEIYRSNAGVYADVQTALDALVGVDTPTSGYLKGYHLSALVDALDALGDGTVGVKGGKYGADYSTSRDREALIAEALGVLYESAFVGAAEDGSFGNYVSQSMNTLNCCLRCGCWPCVCGYPGDRCGVC